MNVAREMGWWWPFQRACILTHRPTALHRDGQGRLHSSMGPALDYDGQWGIWAWHGVRVPQDVIERPDTLDPMRVWQEPNAEVRRVMVERMGLERLLGHTGSVVLHQDTDGPGNPRRLLALDLPGDPDRTLVAVQVVDPSTGRQYMLRVPPNMRTCSEAVAWTFSIEPREYRPAVER
jgi:hypothetical protein